MEASAGFSSTLLMNYQNGSGMVRLNLELPTPPPRYEEATRIVEIRYMRAKAHIRSVAVSPLINFEDTDSDAMRIQKAAALEWDSERIQLNIYLAKKQSPDVWGMLGAISLLNNVPVPYREYNLLGAIGANSFLLDADKAFYFQAEDVGYGTLDKTDDYEDYVSIIISGLITFYLDKKPTEKLLFSIDPLTLNINPLDVNIKGLIINGGNDNNNTDNLEDEEEMPLLFKNSDYTIKPGERVVCENQGNDFTITLPANPTYGDVVEIIVIENEGGGALISLNGNNYIGENVELLFVNPTYPGGKLIYSKNSGWVPYPSLNSSFANA